VPTALVTGATAGIGAAFARLLAGEGYDLVLVSRDGARLAAVAAELQAAGRTVEVLPADLTVDEERARVEARLRDPARPVEVLVNNAGIPARRGFLRSEPDDEERCCGSTSSRLLRLTRAAVGGMVDRRRGAIVNVSSVAAFLSYGTYSASKAWVNRFSEALSVEVAGTGVRVVALCPGMVRTEFHERAGMDVSNIPTWGWLDADDVAAAGWQGVVRGRLQVVPSRRYRVLVALLRHLPPGPLGRVSGATRNRRRLDRDAS
jgi:short-subunit dehydrogenase